ncbi:hypothetical protein V8G54_033684 [Vigna mungo]|uniref:Uncharacterized protein n=1 Tax=Vigna mungo TaxID=3915 RepID=A0AAQ3MPF7_VIGMU
MLFFPPTDIITERLVICILSPTGRIVLGERNKAIVILVVKLHLPLGAMQDLALCLVEVPLSQLVLGDEPIGGVHVDLGEQQYQPVGDIKLFLVIKVILGVHEVLPLGLGLVSRGRVRVRVRLQLRVFLVY